MTLDMDHLSGWIGKAEVMHETLSPELVGRFNATLGLAFSAATGDPAPLLIHLCLAQPAMPADQLGCTAAHICGIEKGKHSISLHMAIKLMQVLPHY